MKVGGLVESEKPMFTPDQVSENLLGSKWMQIPQNVRQKSVRQNFHLPGHQSQSAIRQKPTGNQTSLVPVLTEIPDFYKW